MKSALFPILCAASLAACDNSAPAAANTGAADTNVIDQVAALPEGQRDAMLLRAIRDAGQSCQGVTESVRAGEGRGGLAWLATCTDQSQWVIVLARNGTATVTNARDVAGAAK